MSHQFDFERFHDLLYRASKGAFEAVQRQYEHERFYVIALYTCGDLSYVYPTSSTEEGLTQVAEEYATKKRYRHLSVRKLRERLRWSPCDSPHHLDGEEHFAQVNQLVSKVPAILDGIPTEDSWDEFDAFCHSFKSVCIDVLKELDAEGLFGQGRRRNRIVLNVLMGDQSDAERLEHAMRLNPPSVHKRFRKRYHA